MKRGVLTSKLMISSAWIGFLFKVGLGLSLIGAYWLWQASQFTAIDAQYTHKLLVIEGKIVSLVHFNHERNTQRFNVKVHKIEGGIHSACDCALKIRLVHYVKDQALPVIPGEYWRFVVKLRAPNGQANPGGRNYEDWLFANQIDATGYIVPEFVNERLSKAQWWQINHWRFKASKWIDQRVAERDGRGMIKALLLGDKSELTTEIWQVLGNTGTTHLFAISGLHIGLISALAGLLFSWFWRCSERLCLWIPSPYVVVVTGMFAGLVYSALAGFSVPTLRACMMLMVFGLSFIQGRYYPKWYILLLAFFLVVLFQPRSMLTIGFWFSFLAVGILLYYLPKQHRWLSWLFCSIKTQWSLFLVLMPLQAWYFGVVPLSSPWVNLIAVPLLGIVLLPGLFITAGVSVGFPSILSWAAWVLEKVLDGLSVIASFDPAILFYHVDGWVQVLVLSLSLLIAFFSQLNYVVRSIAGGVAICLLGLSLSMPERDSTQLGEAEITVLDVGQGLAILIRTLNHVVLYDTGYTGMGQRVIAPLLRKAYGNQLDRIVVSHNDLDHRGGLTFLQRLYPEVPVIDFKHCQGKWLLDEVAFEWLSIDVSGKNNQSCVLKLTANGERLLIPGDVEKEAELALVERHPLASRWLIAPHHGSNTSSTPDFLQAVNPEQVVISAGYRSPYRHPSTQVLARYKARNMRIYNTACSGAVRFYLGRFQLEPTMQFRIQNAKFWWRQCH